MKNTIQFLDAVMSRYALPSDYAMAKVLGITRSAVSRYRNHPEATFDDATALKIAAALETDPGYVFACMAAQRAKVEQVRRIWEELAKKLGGAAAAVLLALLLSPYSDAVAASCSACIMLSLAGALVVTLCTVLRHPRRAFFPSRTT